MPRVTVLCTDAWKKVVHMDVEQTLVFYFPDSALDRPLFPQKVQHIVRGSPNAHGIWPYLSLRVEES